MMKAPRHIQGFYLNLRAGRYTVSMHTGAFITNVGLSVSGAVMVYAEVDRAAPKVDVAFYTLRNGDEIPGDATHLGTVIASGEVVHIYTGQSRFEDGFYLPA